MKKIYYIAKKNIQVAEMLYYGNFIPLKGSCFNILYKNNPEFLFANDNWHTIAIENMQTYGMDIFEEKKNYFTKNEEEKIYSIYKNSFERFKVQHLFYILKSKKLEKVWNRICRESEWKNININIPYINK